MVRWIWKIKKTSWDKLCFINLQFLFIWRLLGSVLIPTTELQGSLWVFLYDYNNEAVVLVMPSNDLVYYIQKGRKKTCIERTLHVFFYYRIAGWFDQMLRPMTPTSLNLNGLCYRCAVLNYIAIAYCYYLLVSADIAKTISYVFYYYYLDKHRYYVYRVFWQEFIYILFHYEWFSSVTEKKSYR